MVDAPWRTTSPATMPRVVDRVGEALDHRGIDRERVETFGSRRIRVEERPGVPLDVGRRSRRPDRVVDRPSRRTLRPGEDADVPHDVAVVIEAVGRRAGLALADDVPRGVDPQGRARRPAEGPEVVHPGRVGEEGVLLVPRGAALADDDARGVHRVSRARARTGQRPQVVDPAARPGHVGVHDPGGELARPRDLAEVIDPVGRARRAAEGAERLDRRARPDVEGARVRIAGQRPRHRPRGVDRVAERGRPAHRRIARRAEIPEGVVADRRPGRGGRPGEDQDRGPQNARRHRLAPIRHPDTDDERDDRTLNNMVAPNRRSV